MRADGTEIQNSGQKFIPGVEPTTYYLEAVPLTNCAVEAWQFEVLFSIYFTTSSSIVEFNFIYTAVKYKQKTPRHP